MGKVDREPINEDHFDPERYTTNCTYCKEKVKQACPAPAYSGLECSVCRKKGIPCEWSAPKDIVKNVKTARTALALHRAGVVPEKKKRPGTGGKKADFIDDDPYEEELDGGPLSKRKPSDTLGSSRNRVESRAGPSRLSGLAPETKLKRNDSDSFSQSDRQPKKPRPFGDRPRRTPSPRKRPRQSQDSSELSDPSSPEVSRKQAKRLDRNHDVDATPRAQSPSRKVSHKPSERNVSSISQRPKDRDVSAVSQRPSERNVSAISQRPSDRIASGASGSSQPLTGSQGISKRRNVIASSDEEDEEPSQQTEVPKKAEDDEGDRSRDRTRDDRVEKPRPKLCLSPNRPRPKQRGIAGDKGERSRRREETDEDDGEAGRKDGGDDEDRAEVMKGKRVKSDDVQAEVEAERPRKSKEAGDPAYVDGIEKRAGDRKIPRDELERVTPIKIKMKRPLDQDQADSADKARDVDLERPKKKKHQGGEEPLSMGAPIGAPKRKEPIDVDCSDDEPVKRRDVKLSAVAQRAVEPISSKRLKGDMSGQGTSSGGDATPIARKAARQFGTGSSGRNTPVVKKPAKDMVMDLLTASMSGASSAYASALGMTSSTTKESPYKRPSLMPSKPMIAAPKGTLDLMGTIKTISNFQTAAKKRYSEKYGLMPINNAKSTLTTAFMGRFRERRSRGVYRDALSSLLPATLDSHPEDQAAGEKSQVATWLELHGTPSRLPPRLSVPSVKAKLVSDTTDSTAPVTKEMTEEHPGEAFAPTLTSSGVVSI